MRVLMDFYLFIFDSENLMISGHQYAIYLFKGYMYVNCEGLLDFIIFRQLFLSSLGQNIDGKFESIGNRDNLSFPLFFLSIIILIFDSHKNREILMV